MITAFFYFSPFKQKAATVPIGPDLTKVPQIKIEKIRFYQAGKLSKILQSNEKDFSDLENKLREPVAYSGLFDRGKNGEIAIRIPAQYVPKIEDLITGKAYGYENISVIIVDLARPIDMTFAKNAAGLPNGFNSLVFLPFDSYYRKVIIFTYETTPFTTVPSKPYDPELFSDLLK